MTTMRHLQVLLITLLLILPTVAVAQTVAPSFSLSSSTLTPGDILRFEGSRLAPDSVYTLRLEGPNDRVVETRLDSDADGNVAYEVQLEAVGAWTLRFEGAQVGVVLGIEVERPSRTTSPVPPVAGDPVPDEPGPQPIETAPQPTETEPIETAPLPTETETAPLPTETEPQPADLGPGAGQNPAPTEIPPTTAGDAPETIPGLRPDILLDPGVDFTFRGSDLVALERGAGEELWRLDFVPGSGPSSEAVLHDDILYVGHGYSLLEIDPLTGRVTTRHRLPGAVVALEATEQGIEGRLGTGASDESADGTAAGSGGARFELRDGAPVWQDEEREDRSPLATSPFPADPALFGWLRQEAAVPDPLARLDQDPTNPFLHLRVGAGLTNEGAALGAFQDALEQAETFFEYAQLSQGMFEAGAQGPAERAMTSALRDFAARGYDPRLLTDLDLHAAYGFPLPRFEAALARGGLIEARFWAPWVHALAADTVPETEAALLEFSRQLRSAGDREGANEWRERSDVRGRGGLASTLDRLFDALGRVGWYAVASLLIAILALHLTLIAKYWRPQAVLGRERRAGRTPGPAAHLLAIRFYSLTEKIVLVLLFAAVIALAGLAIWQAEGADIPAAWRRGSLEGPLPAVYAERLRDTGDPLGRFVSGVIAQSQGDDEAAIAAYRAAGDYAPALNNLAVLTGDDGLLERALEADPRLVEARFNSGRLDDPLPFHVAYGAGPLLALPTPGDMRRLAVGSWQDALSRTFTDPWGVFGDARAPGLQSAWLWWTVLALFALTAVITLLWLFVPRPRLARNAPRTFAYQVLALLLPGSGLADELWGVLLLLPWAIFGLDALANYLGWGFGLGFGLGVDLVVLGAIYVVNAVAFVIELGSYNRRMRELKRKDPETALRYGMRVREPQTR